MGNVVTQGAQAGRPRAIQRKPMFASGHLIREIHYYGALTIRCFIDPFHAFQGGNGRRLKWDRRRGSQGSRSGHKAKGDYSDRRQGWRHIVSTVRLRGVSGTIGGGAKDGQLTSHYEFMIPPLK